MLSGSMMPLTVGSQALPKPQVAAERRGAATLSETSMTEPAPQLLLKIGLFAPPRPRATLPAAPPAIICPRAVNLRAAVLLEKFSPLMVRVYLTRTRTTPRQS